MIRKYSKTQERNKSNQKTRSAIIFQYILLLLSITLLIFNTSYKVLAQTGDAPAIVSLGNNVTNNNNLNFNVELLSSVTFNVTANQTIDNWYWTNATIISGNGSPDSNASRQFMDTGSFNISVYGYNANGTTDIITWNVTVVDSAPAQVTGLASDAPTQTTVNLTWTANSEVDLWGYEVFKNDSHLGYTQNNYYNVTGLTASTLYNFMVRANDSSGNWGDNSSSIPVTTAAAPSPTPSYNISGYVLNASGVPISGATVSNSTLGTNTSDANGRYILSGAANGTWRVTATKTGYVSNYIDAIVNGADLTNKNITLQMVTPTPSPTATPQPSGGDSSEGGGGGGGGGGAASGEPYENVADNEVQYILAIVRDKQNTVVFKKTSSHYLVEVSFAYSQVADEVSVSVEKLKNSSMLANGTPPGIIFENVNIWVNVPNPSYVSNASVYFCVDKRWMELNNVNVNTIALYRFKDGKWDKLSTSKVSENETLVFYLASTPGFSPFAIEGEKISVTPTTTRTPNLTPTPVLTPDSKQNITNATPAGETSPPAGQRSVLFEIDQEVLSYLLIAAFTGCIAGFASIVLVTLKIARID